jgi:hypothetical protein
MRSSGSVRGVARWWMAFRHALERATESGEITVGLLSGVSEIPKAPGGVTIQQILKVSEGPAALKVSGALQIPKGHRSLPRGL